MAEQRPTSPCNAGEPLPMTAQRKPTVEEAVLSQSLADIHRAEGSVAQAVTMDAAALEGLNPLAHVTGPITIGRGGEVALADSESQPGIIDTIREKQDMVTARASHQRLALTGNALLLAVDAADSIKARNSLERMKAHQLAALHRLGMKFAAKAERLLGQVDLGISGNRPAHETQAASVEASRSAIAAVRAFGGYDDGMLALDRIRRGGKQTVTVVHQNVAVGPGGQAVVAGSVGDRGTKGKRTRRGRKNGQ
jgi:hypothetical protein